jgi:hypothetical protein
MAKLNAAERRKLPNSAFAIPAKRAYPIPDKDHALDALREVKTRGTEAEQKQVQAAVVQKFPDLEPLP